MSEAITFLNAIRIVPSETCREAAARTLLVFGVSGVVPCFEVEAEDAANSDSVVAPERRRYIQNEFKLRSGYRN
jgi:adenylyl- and sulfurtransferase ThiI